MPLGEKAIDKGPMPRLGWEECRSTARAWELASIHSGGERIEWRRYTTEKTRGCKKGTEPVFTNHLELRWLLVLLSSCAGAGEI